MAPVTKNGMTERRKAETIGELDTHLGYMMAELSTVTQELKEMREHFNTMVSLLATKEELEKLRAEMQSQSFTSLGKRIMLAAAGISAVAAAFGVIVALFRYLNL